MQFSFKKILLVFPWLLGFLLLSISLPVIIDPGKYLCDAVQKGKITNVKLILELNVSLINAHSGKYGNTPLILAAYAADIEMIKYLISKGALIDESNYAGCSPLQAALASNSIDIMKFLISHGAAIDLKDSVGRTALMKASQNGLTNMVSFLIAKGADINIKDRYNMTAIILAKKYAHEDIADLLRQHGAKE